MPPFRRVVDITSDPLPAATMADPRLDEAAIERVDGDDGAVVLVGVLHDHPASTYRARRVVDAVDPAVLALELAPLAVPLAAHHATEERTPPTLGGEMSAAIQAADTDRVVGVDGPSTGFVRRLAAELYAERASLSTVRDAVADLRSVTATAVTRRIAAAIAAVTALQVAVDAPTAYDTGHSGAPAKQAAEERRRVETAASMLRAFTPPPAATVVRSARERHMTERLAALRGTGDVVAVVGMAHLDAVTARLRDGD